MIRAVQVQVAANLRIVEMYTNLEKYIGRLEGSFSLIGEERKALLRKISDYISTKRERSETVKLNFICTHNSRRSHLAQLWAGLAAYHYKLENIETYSGGTEATAFNPRAVAAIERAGFKVVNPGGENPKYEVHFENEQEPFICFSKTFDTPFNPNSGFAAIMTCSDADENCPFVPGTEFRASVTYRDPKESDGTNEEEQTYDERCFQIATEMFYMMSQF
jgi:protein-tyrosine-phosphatase